MTKNTVVARISGINLEEEPKRRQPRVIPISEHGHGDLTMMDDEAGCDALGC